MAAQGASMQNYNNQLVALLEDLKEQKDDLVKAISREEEEKTLVQREMASLTQHLVRLNGDIHSESVAKKVATRSEYDRTIHDTESAYLKVKFT